MPTLYLINAHNNVLLNSEINDTVNLAPGGSESRSLRGSFAVSLPFDIPLDGVPTDLNDLITKKYTGMLALYPGYQNIMFDEQVDAADWLFPPTTGTAICSVGERQATSVTLGGTLESVTEVLASAPSIVVVRWEAYVYGYDDVTGVAATRTYTEADPSVFDVSVSFNAGVTWNTVTNGMLFSVPLGAQGSNFKIRFQRSSGPLRAQLGSWALIY